VAPDSFSLFLSILFLVGLVVGGIGSLAGSVVGGIFYVLVFNSAQAISTYIKNDLGLQFDLSAYTVFGVLLIALMFVMPTGIVGAARSIYRSMRGAQAPAPSERPAVAASKPAASRQGQ
jgi:branched-chain amino acid transport system permease protein